MNKLLRKLIVIITVICLSLGSTMVMAFADEHEPTQEELLAQYYAALAKMTGDEQAALLAKQNEIIAQDNMVFAQIMALKEQFPDGMQWGMEKLYTSPNKGRAMWGQQHACGAFALMVQDMIFGTGRKVNVKQTGILKAVSGRSYQMTLTYYPQTGQYGAWELVGYNGDNPVINQNFEKIWAELRVGDVIADLNHAVVVLTKSPDAITVVEGNSGGKVRWGRRILKESLRKGMQLVESMY